MYLPKKPELIFLYDLNFVLPTYRSATRNVKPAPGRTVVGRRQTIDDSHPPRHPTYSNAIHYSQRRDGLWARPPRPKQSPAPFPGTYRPSSNRQSSKSASFPGTHRPSSNRPRTNNHKPTTAISGRRDGLLARPPRPKHTPAPFPGTHRPSSNRPSSRPAPSPTPFPATHRPSSIVKVGVITPPLDPLPVQGGDGCWVLSPTPFPATHRPSIVKEPTTKNQPPQTTTTNQQPTTPNQQPPSLHPHHPRGRRLHQRNLRRDQRQKDDRDRDHHRYRRLDAFHRRLQLEGCLLLVVIGHLLGALPDVPRLGAAAEARQRHRREHAAGLHRLHQIRPLPHHHRDGDRLHLVLHIGVVRGLGRDLNDADILAAAGIEHAEHAAENFNVELVQQAPDDGYADQVLVQEELPFLAAREGHEAADQRKRQQENPYIIGVHPPRKVERFGRHIRQVHAHLLEQPRRLREDVPHVPYEGGHQHECGDGGRDHRAADALVEFVLALEKARRGLVNLRHVAALRGDAEHVGRKLAQMMLVLHKRLLRLHAALQVGVEVANDLAQALRRDVVDEQVQHVVERQLVAQQVGREPHEHDDVLLRRLRLEGKQLLADGHHLEPHLLEGSRDLLFRECLLLAGDHAPTRVARLILVDAPLLDAARPEVMLLAERGNFPVRGLATGGKHGALHRLTAAAHTNEAKFLDGHNSGGWISVGIRISTTTPPEAGATGGGVVCVMSSSYEGWINFRLRLHTSIRYHLSSSLSR